MSKKSHPSFRFSVAMFHPKTGNVKASIWRADATAARYGARQLFQVSKGFLPTSVGEAKPWTKVAPNRHSPLLAATMLGTAMAMGIGWGR